MKLTQIITGLQKNAWIWIAIILVLILVLLHYYPLKNQQDASSANAPLVVIAAVQLKTIPVYLSALGSVLPTDSITIKTQINGQLLRIHFREGQNVKKGDLLAEIDPRPLESQLLQYQGQLTRDQALLVNAKNDLARYEKLWNQKAVSKQQLDTQRALVDQHEGTVKIDQGLIQGVKVNLAYTKITSPIDGRVGLRAVDPGNYVQVSDPNGIVTIKALDPINVLFSLPEDDLARIITQINAGKTLAVIAYNRDKTKLLARGTLLTIDNQIDTSTGTFKLKALFDNPKKQLYPNQFVNIQLEVQILNNAMIIPTAAIQHGAKGSFVYLVNANNTVSLKAITTTVSYEGDTVVNAGLRPGQKVVVEGADNLTDGSKVTIANIQKNKTNESF